VRSPAVTEPSFESVRRRQRVRLILLALLFLSPALAAWLVFSFKSPSSYATKNHGQLIRPAVPLRDFNLQREDGSAVTLHVLRGKWTLLSIGSTTCDKTCKDTLYTLHQCRLAQGGELRRVQRLYLIAGEGDTSAYKALQRGHADLMVAHGNPVEVNGLVEQLHAAVGISATQPGRVYIIDPLGNVMMTYAPGFEPEGLIKDLERLLRVSQVG